MAIFDDIEFEWEGVPYTLAGDSKIMKVLAAVEDHITISELITQQQSGNVPLAKLSAAYATMLRFAGARVSDAEVYRGMWQGMADSSSIATAITALLAIMVPPGTMDEEEQQELPEDENPTQPGQEAGDKQ